VDSFTLREVARRAGVSHAAPYHHFADKAGLVRALAIDAFARLTQELQAASASNQELPLERLQRIGERYVAFALAHPVEFRFMFRRDLCLTDDTEPDQLEVESLNAMAVLERAVSEAKAAGLLEGDERTVSLTAWSGVHGLAMLLLDAPGFDGLPADQVQKMARGVVESLRLGFEKR
jgi:AcrR family transcriptional regulator